MDRWRQVGIELVTEPLAPEGFGTGIPQQYPWAAGPSPGQEKALPIHFILRDSLGDEVF